MKLELLDLTICATAALTLGIVLWHTIVVPAGRNLFDKEIVTITPVDKHITNEDLLALHNNPARVAEYVKMCAMKNRKILPGDYLKYCINCGETIKVS